MKLAVNIALREISRNRVRLIIACLISLILFLSAFILINISYALPTNFYAYYEEYYGKDLQLIVKNADKTLVGESSKYFESSKINYEFINEKFTVSKDGASFNYVEQDKNNSNVFHVYNANYTGKIEAAQLEKKYGSTDKPFCISGTLWDGSISDNDIWIGDNVAEQLEINLDECIGSELSIGFELSGGETVVSSFIIQGVFDYDLYKTKEANPPVFYMSDNKAINICLDNFDTFSLVGRVNNVSNLYDVYNKLIKKYSIEDTVQVDMLLSVKNAEAIAAIIGTCMLIGGLLVIMNFITMFISTNRKNIGLMLALGAKTNSITVGYGLVYEILLIIITLLSFMVIPTVNALMSRFIMTIGYSFKITTSYWLLFTLYGISNIGMVLIMLIEKLRIVKLTPKNVLKEED